MKDKDSLSWWHIPLCLVILLSSLLLVVGGVREPAKTTSKCVCEKCTCCSACKDRK